MNNSDIEKELLERFGLENLITFSAMASVMFGMLYDHVSQYKENDECCDYDFDRDWWASKYFELNDKSSDEEFYLT